MRDTTFFASHNVHVNAKGQFWKREDPAGNTIYEGHETGPFLAMSGYNSEGISHLYDASGNRHTYNYGLIAWGGMKPLLNVSIERETSPGSGTWEELSRVKYTYFEESFGEQGGLAGDLAAMTTKRRLPNSTEFSSETTFYRYYED